MKNPERAATLSGFDFVCQPGKVITLLAYSYYIMPNQKKQVNF